MSQGLVAAMDARPSSIIRRTFLTIGSRHYFRRLKPPTLSREASLSGWLEGV